MAGTSTFRWGAVGTTTATNLTIAGVTLINGVLLARLLGPERRGELFAVMAYPTVMVGLFGAFIHPAFARRAASSARDATSLRSIAKLAIVSTIPVGVVAGVAATVAMLIAGGLDPTTRLLGIAYVWLWVPTTLINSNLMAAEVGLERWSRYNGFRLLTTALVTVGLALVAMTQKGEAAPGLGIVLGVYPAASLVASAYAYLSFYALGRQSHSFATELAGFYKESRPFFAPTCATCLSNNADQILVSVFLSPVEVGIYAVAQRSSTLVMPVATAVGSVAFSDAARPSANQSASFVEQNRILTTLLLAMTLVMAPILWFVIPVLFGDPFRPAVLPALFMLVASLFFGLSHFGEQRLEGAGKPGVASRGRWVGVIASALGTATMSRTFGLYGVVLAIVCGQFLRYMLLCRGLANHEGVRLRQLLFPRMGPAQPRGQLIGF